MIKVLKGGGVLGVAAAASFLSSVIFSKILSPSQFGELSTLFSSIAIISVFVQCGSNPFFLKEIADYKKYRLYVFGQTAIFSCFFALMYVLALKTYHSISFGLFLVATSLLAQGVLDSQINQRTVRTSLFQSCSAMVKFFAALIALFVVNIKKYDLSGNVIISTVDVVLIYVSIVIIIYLFAFVYFNDRRYISSFEGYLKMIRMKGFEVCKFWASSMLGISYSLGVVPLVAFTQGYEAAAYCGLYMILWGAGNLLIIALLNNYFFPRYSLHRKNKKKARTTAKESLMGMITISIVSLAGLSLFGVLYSEAFWSDFYGIKSFILLVSVALAIRPMSAWLSVIVLNFDNLVMRKIYVQIVVISIMVLTCIFFELKSPLEIAKYIIMLEILYFFGYFFVSYKKAKIIIFGE